MNKKGYLLSELIVSFSLAFVILLAIFNTTINLNQKLSDLFVENKASSQQIIFNRKIGNDFATKKVTAMTSGDESCEITYNDSSSKTLMFHQKTNSSEKSYIEYNNERINVPDNMKIDTNHITCGIDNGIAILKVPIKYSRQKKDYGIELYDISS